MARVCSAFLSSCVVLCFESVESSENLRAANLDCEVGGRWVKWSEVGGRKGKGGGEEGGGGEKEG